MFQATNEQNHGLFSLTYITNADTTTTIYIVAVLSIVLVVTVGIYIRGGNSSPTIRPKEANRSRTTALKEKRTTLADDKKTIESSEPQQQQQQQHGKKELLDVWEERRRKGIEIPATSLSKIEPAKVANQKFVGSSYYYAHNNPNAAGGYKDGLRMEDYTMNQPRLLSRNGTPATSFRDGEQQNDNNPAAGDDIVEQQQAPEISAAAAAGTATTESASSSSPLSVEQNQTKSSPPHQQNANILQVPITKYLWDDPGDANTGIATIRIDELPERSSAPSKTIPWKDCHVPEDSVTACLVPGENKNNNNREQGLLVVVRTPAAHAVDGKETEYRLHIPVLYGPASDVQVAVKSKRLLVKLYKTKKNFFDGNLKPWPYPQKKKLF